MEKSKVLVSFVSVLFTCILLAFSLTACSLGEHTHTPAEAVKENETAATCKEAGSYDEVVYCSVCGEEISRTQKSIAKLTTHTPATAVKENETAATCKNEGSYDEVVYCSVCGKELSRTKIKTAERLTEHNIQNGECTVCGAKESTAGLIFSLNSDGKSYTVTDIGTCTASDIVIDLHNGMPVTSIGSSAFYNCTNLTSITIPDSVTSIGDYAFSDCYKLVEVINKSKLNITAGFSDNGKVAYYAKEVRTDGESKIVNYNNTGYLFYTYNNVNYLLGYTGNDKALTLPENYNGESYEIYEFAFLCRDDITSVTIGNGVTSIGNSAFSVCTSLTSVTIPNSVTSIGDYAFSNCYKLVEVINKSKLNITAGSSDNGRVAKYAKEVHEGESKIVNYKNTGYIFYTTKNRDNYLLGYTDNDKALTLPESYNGESYEIYWYAFYNRDDITSVTIPDSVTSIGAEAFHNCYKLVEVINKSKLNITAGSYNNGGVAEYAKEVKKSGESKIANKDGYIFYTTRSGTNYLIDYIGNEKDLTLPEDYNGENYEIYQYAFYDRNDITSVTIPDSVTSIGERAFWYCWSLTSVTMGNGVTSIGKDAFQNCTSLTSITIPDSVTSIDYSAFSYCTSLTSVTIGNGVTSIGKYAFSDCTSLTSVAIGNGVTSIGYYAFEDCTRLRSVYYKGTASEWSNVNRGFSNSYLTDATRYYYSETAPTETGNYWHYGENGEIVVWSE